MNTFLKEMTHNDNIDYTENGGITRKSTESKVLDMFGMGGAYRNRSDEDVILLFKNAFEENAELAMKCLFYLRDVRGGQGERRFFRVAFNWLCKNYPETAKKNIENIIMFGRVDDIMYCTFDTPREKDALKYLQQLINDSIKEIQDAS